MRIVGRRKLRPIQYEPSGELLAEGARFTESLQRLPGASTFMRKGVYRFRTIEEADRHRDQCLIEGMARLARKAS